MQQAGMVRPRQTGESSIVSAGKDTGEVVLDDSPSSMVSTMLLGVV